MEADAGSARLIGKTAHQVGTYPHLLRFRSFIHAKLPEEWQKAGSGEREWIRVTGESQAVSSVRTGSS